MVDRPVRITELTPIQRQYYWDTHRFTVCSAGRRSRKTLIGARKVLRFAFRNRDKRYFFGAPTEQQAKAIFWKGPTAGLTHNVPSVVLAEKPNQTELSMMLLNGTFLQVVGLDKPARIEGVPWDGCILTEVPDMKPDFWKAHIRPLLSDTNGFAILDGVPEGRNHYYDLALYAAGGAIPTTFPGKGAYAENPEDPEWAFYSWFSADVLDPAEIEALKRGLDEKTFRQEGEGSFEGMEGVAYYAFGPENMKNVQRAGGYVHIGMDFNVDPMTAVLCHIDGDTINQWGEAWLRNSNTYEMVRHLKEVLKINPAQCTIYPDSTGKARESNATESDLKILRDAGFRVLAHSINPRQRDRVNAVNTRICSTTKQRRYFVNQSACPKTINDLNRAERLSDGRLNKAQETTGIGHISAALGYLIAYLFPLCGGGIET